MSQPQQPRAEDEDEDMHETVRDHIKTEEPTRHETPSLSSPQQQTTPQSFSIADSPSAADILQPLSSLAAQRSVRLPTSGSLASLASRRQHDPADGRRTDRDFESTASSGSIGSSWMHERLLQSDSIVDATTTSDLVDVGSDATAVRSFTTTVWESPTPATTTAETVETMTESKPMHRTVSAYSSSPFSSPSSSLVEGSSGPLEEDEDHHTVFLSPFSSIFPEGTNTITPLFVQRFDDDDDNNSNNDTAGADPRTVLKYSESIQLFRRRPEDGGKTWKRRVFEYR